MNILSLIAAVASTLSLLMGLYILYLDKKSAANKLFFNMCFWLFITMFSAVFTYSSAGVSDLIFNVKFTFLGYMLFYPSVLLFFIKQTRTVKIHPLIICIIFMPALILIFYEFLIVNGNIIFSSYYRTGDYWIVKTSYSVAAIICYICLYIYYIASLVCIFLWYKRNSSRKERIQSIIMFYLLLVITLADSMDVLVLPEISSYETFGATPIVHFVWVIGMWITILKYKFLSMTPEVVSNEIISGIDESVILLDRDAKVIRINKRTESITGIHDNERGNISLQEIFTGHNLILDEIELLQDGDYNSFSCSINMRGKDDSKTLMDIKVSIIKDSYNDIIGYLVIGKEIKGLKQLKSFFKITERETEVIQSIMHGVTNREIAAMLGVTENTLKRHITNIYNKLGVENKVQMLAFMKEFRLLPEFHADKLLLKK